MAQDDTLLVVEPTYGRGDHAPLNAAVLSACRIAFPERRLVFAASDRHRDAVMPLLAPDLRVECTSIAVMTPVGRHIRRFLSQFDALRRSVARARPSTALVLSSGPETFFAARAIAALHPALRVVVMLHGNAGLLLERRTRDPRYRAFDYTAGFRATRHPRIRTVVLESHIADVIAQRFPDHPPSLVWPHPIPPCEAVPSMAGAPRFDTDNLRVGFVGAAARSKGFDQFLEIAGALRGGPVEFRLAGYLSAEFRPGDVPFEDVTTTPMPRETFLAAIRGLDFAYLPFDRDVYQLTASGSLLDCIANLVPVIATPSTLLARLTRDYGPIGHLCETPRDALAMLRDPRRLGDARASQVFRANLARIRADRLPGSLAQRLRADLAAPGGAAMA